MTNIRLNDKKTILFSLADIGIYIFLRAKEQGMDPVKIGITAAEKLKLRPLDAETLWAAIGMARHGEIDENLRSEVEGSIEQEKELKGILDELFR